MYPDLRGTVRVIVGVWATDALLWLLILGYPHWVPRGVDLRGAAAALVPLFGAGLVLLTFALAGATALGGWAVCRSPGGRTSRMLTLVGATAAAFAAQFALTYQFYNVG